MRATASVLHLDLDAFYASVEQRDKPSLRGKPVVVGGTGGRGVVATASYEARRYGVRSAMSTREARSRCPHAAFLSPRFSAYREASDIVMGILRDVSPHVEPLSLDEAFVDLAEAAPGRVPAFGTDELIEFATDLRRRVTEATDGLTASVGIATSKFVAKVASDLEKPNGLVVVAPGEELTLLRPMAVTVIPGVGPATGERLRRSGIQTVADLETVSLEELVRMVGKAHGRWLYDLARAEDDRPVVAEREVKSVSVEGTYDTDLTDRTLMEHLLTRQAEEVSTRLRKNGLSGRTVTIKVRLADFTTLNRSSTLASPVDDASTIAKVARNLLGDMDTATELYSGVRLLGVGVSGIADWVQDALFTDEPDEPQDVEAPAPEVPDEPQRSHRQWVPGMDVVHDELGRGWVWGAGRGVVTVRFETRETPAGPVRSFPVDDEALHRYQPADRVAGMQPPVAPDQSSAPPVAKRVPVTTTHHGHTRVDDYEWLREKDNPEVIAYLEAENAYAEERLAHLAPLRQALFDEMKARTVETDLSLPVRNRGYWYYGRSFEGRDYGASCRVPVADPDDWTPPQVAQVSPDQPALPGEQVLLDLDELAQGHDFFSLGGSAVSPSTTMLAYAVDVVGDERYTVHVKELATGELLDDVLENVHGGAIWDLSSTALYYVTGDESWRPDSVWRHVLGTPQSEDELVYHEADERFWVGIDRTRSNRFMLIGAGGKVTTEFRYLDLQHPDQGWQLFAPRVEGVEYHLDHAVIGGEDVFLVLHNATGPDFEVATTPIAPTPPDQWRPLIPYDPDVRLEDVDAFAGHLVVHQRSNGLTQLRILELGDAGVTDDYLVGFDDEIYTIGSGGNPAWEQPTVRLGYTTMRTPASVYDYDVRTRELTLRKQKVVLGGYDRDDYEEHRLWAAADDGVQVPISIVVRKDVRAAGRPVPVHLYGYGSYEASIDPGFSTMRLSELDRGAAFAIAHVRGGGEMGRRWYDDGKLMAKRNTFTDFIACARHLVETGWTTPELTIAEGASAGGLLVGAVANLAPEQFGGIVAGVPFVDALTTMLDASLPLTITEYDEWGNPEQDPEAYAYIAGYAPYDNVGQHRYPPIYVDTSLNDTRVLYVEPAKWVAKLRATAGQTGTEPDIVLRTEMAAGHAGVSGRYKAWQERAFTLAWVLDRMGLAEARLKSR